MDNIIIGGSNEYWELQIQTRLITLKILGWTPYSPLRRAFVHAFYGREACYYDVQQHMVAFVTCVEEYCASGNYAERRIWQLRNTVLDPEWVPENTK